MRWWRPLTAWAVAAPWGTWTAVWALGLERGYPLVPLIAFTPYVAAASIVPPVVALVLRQRCAALVALAVAVTLVAGVAPRGLPLRAAQVDDPKLRVLTANLLVGRGDPQALVRLVSEQRVDVLSLQELSSETAGDLDRAGLSALLPYRHAVEADGGEGSGIYSRLPLRPLPQLPSDSPLAMPRAQVDIRGAAPVEVVAVHALPPVDRHAIGRWAADLGGLPGAETPGPVRVLAGDFNATLDHRALRALLATGYVDAAAAAGRGWVPTFPGNAARFPPPVTIDHILVDRRAKIGEVSVYDLEGSDHRPVLVEVGLVPHTGAVVADRDADRDEALLRWATSDRRLIQRMLSLTPEERLRGLARAAAFFAAARRA